MLLVQMITGLMVHFTKKGVYVLKSRVSIPLRIMKIDVYADFCLYEAELDFMFAI